MTPKKRTDLECFTGLLNREKATRVLHIQTYPLAFAAIQAGKTIHDAYYDASFSYESQKQLAFNMDWLFYPAYPSIGGGWGGDSSLEKGSRSQSPVPVTYAVQSEEEAWALIPPQEFESIDSIKRALEFYQLSVRDKEVDKAFDVTLNTAGPFTMAAQICGLDRMARWLIKQPDIVHHLLKLTSDYISRGAAFWLDKFKHANPVFYLSEPISSNQVISPKQFEQFALPYIKETHQKALAMGYQRVFCHICGDHNANLPFWAEIPMGDPGIISIGSEIDLDTAAQYFPNDIIYGNIDPLVLQIGSQAEVYEATKRVIIKGKAIPNGFIFGPGCELPPKAKPESIFTMIKTIEKFGLYD